MDKITEITCDLLTFKLKESYNLSYGSLDSYKIIKTNIKINDNLILIGEITPLPGYSDETEDSIIKTINKLKKQLIGKTITEYINFLKNKLVANNSFAISALLPPVEYFKKYNNKFPKTKVSSKDIIYLLDINSSKNEYIRLQDVIDKIQSKGYESIKIKIGSNFSKDQLLIEKLSKINLYKLKIRFDANCSYSIKQTKLITKQLSECLFKNTDYLEQPLKKNAWKDIEKITNFDYKIPMLLDESIFSIEDIKKAYNIGIRHIKIKLCKIPSFDILDQVIKLAEELKINLVFGNGVATDISNYYELIYYLRNKKKFYGASESIGFLKLKQKASLLEISKIEI